MLVHERRAALESLLRDNGSIVVSELARQWDVSEMTVRRDLRALQDRGMLERVHGGAVAHHSLRFSDRRGKATRAKREAVARLLPLVPERGSIYLDGSTTVLGLAEQLHKHSGLRVATNNLSIFQSVSQHPGIDVCLIGGELEREVDNFVGPLAQRTLEALSFDAAFMSAYGLHSDVGLCEPSLADAAIKAQVVLRSEHAYLAMNSEKFERRAAGTWSAEREKMTLATELAPDDQRLQSFTPFFASII